MSVFHESNPINLSNQIFKCYHFCKIEKTPKKKNTGILIEDGHFEFTFIKEKDIKLKTGTHKNLISLPTSFLMGKPMPPFRFIIPQSLTFFTLKIQPWVTSFFYDHDEFEVIDLYKKFGNQINVLNDKIFQSDSFPQMVKHVEAFFASIKMPTMSEFKISQQICEEIYQKNGIIKVKELLSQFPHSRQRINKLFLHQTKNSIKEFAMFVRIRAVMNYKFLHPEESLTAIAYEFGYFDQSHFIKDLKKVTGITPSDFLANENLFSSQLKEKT